MARILRFRDPSRAKRRWGVTENGHRVFPIQHHRGSHQCPGIFIAELPFVQNQLGRIVPAKGIGIPCRFCPNALFCPGQFNSMERFILPKNPGLNRLGECHRHLMPEPQGLVSRRHRVQYPCALQKLLYSIDCEPGRFPATPPSPNNSSRARARNKTQLFRMRSFESYSRRRLQGSRSHYPSNSSCFLVPCFPKADSGSRSSGVTSIASSYTTLSVSGVPSWPLSSCRST